MVVSTRSSLRAVSRTGAAAATAAMADVPKRGDTEVADAGAAATTPYGELWQMATECEAQGRRFWRVADIRDVDVV